MDKIVYDFLTALDNETPLNFGGLIKFINENNIVIKNSGIETSPCLTTDETIYIDVYEVDGVIDSRLIYYMLLHEISHYLRFRKLGNNYARNVYQIKEFKLFMEMVIYEEEFADRLAHLLYYKLNGATIDYYHRRMSNEGYKKMLEPIFEEFRNGTSYDSMLDYILFERDEELLNPIS